MSLDFMVSSCMENLSRREYKQRENNIFRCFKCFYVNHLGYYELQNISYPTVIKYF